jgi:hypothetical protein
MKAGTTRTRPASPEPFNEQARRWFRGITPEGQVLILKIIAQLKAWKLGRNQSLPVSVLLATPEQRRAARKLDADAHRRRRQGAA